MTEREREGGRDRQTEREGERFVLSGGLVMKTRVLNAANRI